MPRRKATPRPDEADFRELIARALSADPQVHAKAWDELCRWMQPFLADFIPKVIGLRRNDDRLLEFVRCFPGRCFQKGTLGQWNPAGAAFPTWLQTVAKNAFMDEYLRPTQIEEITHSIDAPRPGRERGDDPEARQQPNPLEEKERSSARAALISGLPQAMRIVPPQRRMLLKLRFGMPLADPEELAAFESAFRIPYSAARLLKEWTLPTAEFLSAEWRQQPPVPANTIVVWGVRDLKRVREEMARLGLSLS